MTNDDFIFPIEPYFAGISCSHCGKQYGKDFARCREQGIPLYYTWDKQRPLDKTTIGPAVKGSMKIDWFCSAKCSNSGVNHLLRAQTEKQPTSFLNQQEYGPSRGQVLLRDQLNLSRKQEK